MWENNKAVQHVYATAGSQQVWAIFEGMAGWKRIAPGSPDGVTNVAKLLTTAKSYGRKVNVFMNNDNVERAWML